MIARSIPEQPSAFVQEMKAALARYCAAKTPAERREAKAAMEAVLREQFGRGRNVETSRQVDHKLAAAGDRD